jgi:hypothetical protein
MHESAVLAPPIPSIEIFVRHADDCPRGNDPHYKNCRCPKHLRWSHGGKQHRQAARTRTWSIAEERRRDIEERLQAADPAQPVKSIKIAAQTRPTLEQAVQLYLTDKLTQGLDPTAYQKHVRELGRMTEFMTRRGKFFPHEIGLADLTEFRATPDKPLPLFRHPFEGTGAATRLPSIRLQFADDRPYSRAVSYQSHRAYPAAYESAVREALGV